MVAPRRWLMVGMLAWIVSGCGGVPGRIFAGSPPTELLEAEYQIHANDELEIAVWGQADLTRTVRVREDGTFSFPFVGEMVAQRRTLRELEEAIAAALAQGYLVNPHVTAKLVGSRFSILGEIERPGTYPIEGRVDLLAAISMAGGVTKFGSSRVEIIRLLADGQKVSYLVDVADILSGRRPTLLVHPHDTLHVKRRLF